MKKVVIYTEWYEIKNGVQQLIKHYVGKPSIDEETGAKLYRWEYDPKDATDFGTVENARNSPEYNKEIDKIEEIIIS